ncbi:MAG: glycosyl hydrolase family 28-related protein [Candidatus Acidiferrales bacterium]
MKKIAAVSTLFISLALLAPAAGAQGSRKDDIVFGPTGHPVAGATVTICQATATGTPCTPLATIYTDATLTTTSANPFQTDGIGNYHFYAPAGRYMIQISSPQISGTLTYPDVILPPDVSSSGSGNNISAFGLTLGGNLTVAGNATVDGTLTTSTFSPGAFTPSSLNVTGNASFQGPRPYIDVTAYGAVGNNTHDDTAAIQSAINAFCSSPSTSNGGTIFFPPGTYKVTQTQTPSTSHLLDLHRNPLRGREHGGQERAGIHRSARFGDPRIGGRQPERSSGVSMYLPFVRRRRDVGKPGDHGIQPGRLREWIERIPLEQRIPHSECDGADGQHAAQNLQFDMELVRGWRDSDQRHDRYPRRAHVCGIHIVGIHTGWAHIFRERADERWWIRL